MRTKAWNEDKEERGVINYWVEFSITDLKKFPPLAPMTAITTHTKYNWMLWLATAIYFTFVARTRFGRHTHVDTDTSVGSVSNSSDMAVGLASWRKHKRKKKCRGWRKQKTFSFNLCCSDSLFWAPHQYRHDSKSTRIWDLCQILRIRLEKFAVADSSDIGALKLEIGNGIQNVPKSSSP